MPHCDNVTHHSAPEENRQNLAPRRSVRAERTLTVTELSSPNPRRQPRQDHRRAAVAPASSRPPGAVGAVGVLGREEPVQGVVGVGDRVGDFEAELAQAGGADRHDESRDTAVALHQIAESGLDQFEPGDRRRRRHHAARVSEATVEPRTWQGPPATRGDSRRDRALAPCNQTRTKHLRPVVLALIALLGAGLACSESESGTPVAPDYVRLSDDDALYLPVGERPAGRGLLRGPHFAVEVDRLAAVGKVDGGSVRALGLEGPIRAADGHELVLVHVPVVSPAMERTRWDPEGAHLETALVVGEEARPLPRLPHRGDVVIVSAPEDESVLLRVTDDGRAFTMNLRDGSVAPDSDYAVVVSEKLTVREYQATGTARTLETALPLTYVLEINMRLPEQAYRDPFVPGEGWAKESRAWLVISDLSAVSDLSFSITLTILLTGPDGTRQPAQPGPVTSNLRSPVFVYFDVPESFRDGVVTIAPSEPQPVDRTARAAWLRPPAAADVPISFPA